MGKRKIVYLLMPVLVLGLGAVIAAYVAPLLEQAGAFESSTVYYDAMHRICHQLPGRCFWINTSPLALCSRCLGIYMGLGAVSLLFIFLTDTKVNRFVKIPGRVVFYMIIPVIVDPVMGSLGGWEGMNSVRFITGFSSGAGCVILYLKAMSAFSRQVTLRFKKAQ